MIYFFSDAHYGHRNICLGVSTWTDLSKCRDFHSIEKMNMTIVKSINSIVKKDDTLYHIGDWSFGGWENIWNFRKQIVCENIIQVNGNHDIHIMKNKFFPHLEKQYGLIYEIDDKNEYHTISNIKNDNDVTAHDMFSEVYDDVIKININGQIIVLSHHPLDTWEDMKNGSWHLHGHTHHDIDNSIINLNYKRFDVGWIDKVYSFDDIKNIMDNRKIKNK